jgi:hypothetical protein
MWSWLVVRQHWLVIESHIFMGFEPNHSIAMAESSARFDRGTSPGEHVTGTNETESGR